MGRCFVIIYSLSLLLLVPREGCIDIDCGISWYLHLYCFIRFLWRAALRNFGLSSVSLYLIEVGFSLFTNGIFEGFTMRRLYLVYSL